MSDAQYECWTEDRYAVCDARGTRIHGADRADQAAREFAMAAYDPGDLTPGPMRVVVRDVDTLDTALFEVSIDYSISATSRQVEDW